MVNVPLHEFIGAHREELIARCTTELAKRAAPTTIAPRINHGVPFFLDQLIGELRGGAPKTEDVVKGARTHGRELLLQGFAIAEGVYEYGDLRRAVTDLAVETDTVIGAEDIRILNRSLDLAIAGAVTQHACGQAAARDGESHDLLILLDSATAAFEALRKGQVGVGGSTGAILHRSLASMHALLDRPKRIPA